MKLQASALQSIADVCELEWVESPDGRGVSASSPAPSLLIEVPHGATRRRHFEATRRLLEGRFPEDLEEFFYVNTDVGSIECARWVARMVVSPSDYPELELSGEAKNDPPRSQIESVLIVRGLVARTFLDLNRVLVPTKPSGMTPAIPGYVSRPEDVQSLTRMHGEYQELASRAYEMVCRSGSALVLHTYAPRIVEIDQVDDGIVEALRRAYAPDVYAELRRRPDVDLITESTDGSYLAPADWVRSLRSEYARIGIEVTENASYRLHESTTGYVHSANHPGRVLCVEINRELLADPFTPFAEMSISDLKARRMAAPIAAAFLACQRSAMG